ncbi:MAG: beta-propeller fold lactonase family protein, partial [Synergistaceae bacterium]|nr:beta-propeller fold lactonase family protein [Synergistaceae bacterium]
MIAYVGCRTTEHRNARGKGIRAFRIDGNGEWHEFQTLKTPEENPSYQALDHTGKFLYSVHGDFTKVSSYRVKEDYTLELMNVLELGPTGQNPVFIVPDKSNKFMIVASLQGGTVHVIRRNDDGTLGEIVHRTHLPGKTEG